LRWLIGGRQQVRGDLPRLGGVEEVLAVKADGLSSRRESVESHAVRPASSRAGICPFGVPLAGAPVGGLLGPQPSRSGTVSPAARPGLDFAHARIQFDRSEPSGRTDAACSVAGRAALVLGCRLVCSVCRGRKRDITAGRSAVACRVPPRQHGREESVLAGQHAPAAAPAEDDHGHCAALWQSFEVYQF
jgi:hypothetical protein